MKRILITGASGFIGSFLVEEALAQGYEVYAGIRSTSSKVNLSDNRIKFLELDFANAGKLERTFSDLKNSFDFIIHNAGITKARQPKDFVEVNYQYTRNFVDALRSSQAIPKKFVYISSLAAYGPGKTGQVIRHEDEPSPISFYGRSKLQSEKYLQSLKDFPFVIIRPSTVYGPRDKELYVLYKVLNRGLEPYIGSTQQKLSAVYVGDLVRSIYSAIDSPNHGRAYFVGDGNEYTIEGFNKTIKKHLERKTVKIVLPTSVAKPVAFAMEKVANATGRISTFNRERLKEYEALNWLCDTTPLKQELNFKPVHDLDSGMRETIQWYRMNNWL